MGKSLVEKGFRIILINKVNTLDKKIEKSGEIDSVEYIYLTTKRRRSVLKKITTEIKANLLLFNQLKKIRSNSKCNYFTISQNSLTLVIYYRLICWALGYKLIFSLMEHKPSNKQTKIQKYKFFIFWNFTIFFADTAIPISQLIFNKIKLKSKNTPLLIIPALGDFSSTIESVKQNNEHYFCYCGSTGYEDIINLINS